MSPETNSATASIRRHLLIAATAAILLFAGAGGWAATTQLAGAVVATGSFVVDSNVKAIQHPTGGVVGEILVREGQRVRAGEPLMRLDPTQINANLAVITKRLAELEGRAARLEAERDDLPEIAFPESLSSGDTSTGTVAIVRGETSLFQFRRESREGRRQQLAERMEQFTNEIAGLKAQEEAYSRALEVVEREIADLRKLYEKGLVSIQRLNALEREVATLAGERGEAIAGQAQAAGRIAETELQILQIDQDLKSEVATELRDVQAQIGEYTERKIAAEDEYRRIELLAPQDGFIHQLNMHTIGGVISPADIVMLIVPDNDDLTLEVRIAPQDIDQVHLGQAAVVRLSAFNHRTTPDVNGQVTRIAADLTLDQQLGYSYYKLRIAVASDELDKLGELKLVPGMPAEAFIRTSDRTVLSFLVQPLADQVRRAFREE